MRVNKKGVNRLALDMFRVKMANRYAVSNLSDGLQTDLDQKSPGSFRRGFLWGVATETMDFLDQNLDERDAYNFISARQAFIEMAELFDAKPDEVYEMLDLAWDFLREVEVDKEVQVTVEEPKKDLVVEYSDPNVVRFEDWQAREREDVPEDSDEFEEDESIKRVVRQNLI